MGKSEKDSGADLNQLCMRAQQGDKTAENRLFQNLFERFRLAAGYRIRNKEETEEVCQNAMKTIIEKYREIDFEGGFAAWAYKVLDNKVRKSFELRERKRRRETELPDDRDDILPASDDCTSDLRRKLLECLKEINRVNSRFARVIVLQFQGFKVDEICKKMKITRNNLYVLLSRSRSLLKQCLETGGLK